MTMGCGIGSANRAQFDRLSRHEARVAEILSSAQLHSETCDCTACASARWRAYTQAFHDAR